MEEKQKTKQIKMKKEKPLTVNDVLKYEIASELGLMDKVTDTGWKSLTAKESGRIGGILTKRKRDMKAQGMDLKHMMVEEIKLD